MRRVALLEAFVAVCLWSFSPLLVKMTLEELEPTQLAGVRYFIAFLALLPLLVARSRKTLVRLTPMEWLRLGIMGVVTYTIGNSLFFWGLETLSATTSSVLLNLVPLFTLGIGGVALQEKPNKLQWLGIGIAVIGIMVFFGFKIDIRDWAAVAATAVGSLALAVNGVMARAFARGDRVDILTLTTVPLFFGGVPLIAFAPPARIPSARIVGMVIWLAVLNSALAYILWNHSLRQLKAFELGFVGNLMPMGTALLAPLMLGEQVSLQLWIGIAVSLAGVILVSVAGESNQRNHKPPDQTVKEGNRPKTVI